MNYDPRYALGLTWHMLDSPFHARQLIYQNPDCRLRQYRLWSSKCGDTKFEIFLPQNQHTQRKLLYFENWRNGKVSKRALIGLSKSIFYVKNHRNHSHFFFVMLVRSNNKFQNYEWNFLLRMNSIIFFGYVDFWHFFSYFWIPKV